jgi:hypothetical protein
MVWSNAAPLRAKENEMTWIDVAIGLMLTFPVWPTIYATLFHK